MAKDLTQLEIPRLPETFNLTDGHAHRPLDSNEQRIIEALPQTFFEVEREQQPDIERSYVDAFYSLTRQHVDPTTTNYFLLPSASISLEIVANYLRLTERRLALIEPCFDNLANMFKRHHVPLTPFPEHYLQADQAEVIEFLASLDVNALCIVSPNNPTGTAYSPEIFELLVDFCKKRSVLFVLDSSFRVYKAPQDVFDEYALLQQSGIDYVVVEDTGKTWPTKELKVSILAISNSIRDAIYDIYSDFTYHHSPVAIRLLTQFIQNSKQDGLQSVVSVIHQNRETLLENIEGLPLTLRGSKHSSVAWLELPDDMSAAQFAALLGKQGVFVLPGNLFFWSDHAQGDRFVRIALARDPALFARAAKKIPAVFDTL